MRDKNPCPKIIHAVHLLFHSRRPSRAIHPCTRLRRRCGRGDRRQRCRLHRRLEGSEPRRVSLHRHLSILQPREVQHRKRRVRSQALRNAMACIDQRARRRNTGPVKERASHEAGGLEQGIDACLSHAAVVSPRQRLPRDDSWSVDHNRRHSSQQLRSDHDRTRGRLQRHQHRRAKVQRRHDLGFRCTGRRGHHRVCQAIRRSRHEDRRRRRERWHRSTHPFRRHKVHTRQQR